jgi:uncharacterized membrane protein
MSYWKSFGLAVFVGLCLLGEATGSAQAQCNNSVCATEWSGNEIVNLGGLPGSTTSGAFSINNVGQAVGSSDSVYATQWSGGHVINLKACQVP